MNYNLNKSDKEEIKEIFTEYLLEYDKWGKALWWEWTKEQEIRFKILLEIIKGDNHSLLDVWCGTWDLYKYIKNKTNLNIKYNGIDLLIESIKTAKKQFPDSNMFSVNEIHNIPKKSFDYVIASWIFAVNIENAKKKYFSLIDEMFKRSKKWFAFNMLTKDFLLKDAPEIIQFDPIEVLKYCKIFTSKVELRKWYLDIDFTIFMYHE